MRKGFSLITAIFVMVLMATLALFILNLSAKVTKETSAQYYQEQAALLARSYTELAVMAVIYHDRNTTGSCVEDINGVVNGIRPGETPTGSTADGSGYDVQTRIYYIGNGLPCSGTRELTDNAANSATTITTNYGDVTGASDALAAIIVDVYVRYRDPDNLGNWLTYHRRTLQKI
ncbi:MAG: type II secretion system protein [Campylobacterales bacterium]|nr:type II secretion system protein [Campylobacterales bacterium]